VPDSLPDGSLWTSGSIRTLRFEGDYIYGETVLPDNVVEAGVFFLMDVK
jgi:hypothetical protein